MPARRRRAADPLLAEKGKSPFILLGGHRRVTKKILLPGRWSREKKKKASVEPVQTPSHSYYVYLIFPTRKFYHSTPSRCFWSALSQVDFLFAHLGSSFQRCQYVSDESRHVGDCTISSWLAVTSAVFFSILNSAKFIQHACWLHTLLHLSGVYWEIAPVPQKPAPFSHIPTLIKSRRYSLSVTESVCSHQSHTPKFLHVFFSLPSQLRERYVSLLILLLYCSCSCH